MFNLFGFYEMKQLLYIFLFIAAYTAMQSQPTLTNKIIPEIGEIYTLKFCDTVGVSNGEAGAAKTWDYSKLVYQTGEGSSYTYQVVNPADGTKSSLFPSATFAYKTESSYLYYKANSNDIERLGIGYESGHEVLEDTEILYFFPFNYGDSKSDIFRGKLVNVADEQTINTGRYGNAETKADGYGTLIIPSGTYPNMLRLKTTQNIYDTLSMAIPGLPPFISHTETISYTWINDNFHFGLLSISTINNTQTIMGNEIKTVSRNVVVQDANPSVEASLTQPKITSPVNGAKDLEIPFLVQWTESELINAGSIKGVVLNEVMYHLEASLTPDFSNEQLIFKFDPTTATSYEFDMELDVPDSPLYLRVSSSYGDIVSEWSQITSFTLKSVDPPVAPTLLLPANGSKDLSIEKVRFEWSHPENSENITYQFRIRSENENMEVFNGPDNFFEMMNLDLGTTYYWSVRADRNMSDTSKWSEEWSFTTEPVVSVRNIIFNDNSIEALPNPASDLMNLSFTTENDDFFTMKVYSVEGNLSSVKILGNLRSGSNFTELDLSNLSVGAYYVLIEGQNVSYVRSIVVNR